MLAFSEGFMTTSITVYISTSLSDQAAVAQPVVKSTEWTSSGLGVLKKRHFFVPEPDRIGRPWGPDGMITPPQLQHIKRIQFNPLDEFHRESHMEEMLEFINKTNWTCGQDMKNFGGRKSKLSDSKKFSVQSTQRADFSGHWMGVEARRNPGSYASVGATPTTYHVIPYVPPECHPFTTRRSPPSEPPTEDQKNVLMKVRHYIMEPYPGPQLPEHLRNKQPRIKTVAQMGLVE